MHTTLEHLRHGIGGPARPWPTIEPTAPASWQLVRGGGKFTADGGRGFDRRVEAVGDIEQCLGVASAWIRRVVTDLDRQK
jgi:hypothetical protein